MSQPDQSSFHDHKPATCPECQVGRLKHRFVAYFTWIGRDYVSVPDFPAWVCDVCSYCEYDSRAMRRLDLLLSPIVDEPAKVIQRRAQKRKTDHLPPAIG